MLIEAMVAIAFTGADPSNAAEAAIASRPPAPEISAPTPVEGVKSSVIGDDDLMQARGGETTIINDQTLLAIIEGNVMGDYTAGSITISDQALSSFNGFGNLLINTGAQNNLQAGMSVTINVNP